MSQDQSYEVFAVRYARRDARRPEHFVGGDPHDGSMPMDYFVWAVVGRDRSWVIDTGFAAADAEARGRTLLRTAAEGLALVGVDAGTAEDVVVTHLHYDHIGGFDQFPNARFHLQEREMAYATGRHMGTPALGHAFTADHIAGMVHRVFEGRVAFHDGAAELAPGLSLHHVGGHTMGLQVVRVRTRRGWLVLASDASHFYENMEATTRWCWSATPPRTRPSTASPSASTPSRSDRRRQSPAARAPATASRKALSLNGFCRVLWAPKRVANSR
jgi:glyoxylase-like metal-dependent hydrolase (beta-lactamase superfamily II)